MVLKLTYHGIITVPLLGFLILLHTCISHLNMYSKKYMYCFGTQYSLGSQLTNM